MGHAHAGNEKKLFLAKKPQQKQIISFQNFFILSKYHMFRVSYESFSMLGDVFCQKSIISS